MKRSLRYNREGGGGTRTEIGVGSHQEGRGQRDADAHSNETTLPVVGRVVGHVRLYGERGRGGGGSERRAPRILQRGRGPTTDVGHSKLSRTTEYLPGEEPVALLTGSGNRTQNLGINPNAPEPCYQDPHCSEWPSFNTYSPFQLYGTSRTIAGRRLLRPPKPTPKPSTTNRIGR